MPDNGWVKLYRCLLDKPIWSCSTSEQKVVLITLLLMANHEEKEWEWQGEKVIIKPGQFITSLEGIAKKAGVSIRNVRTALQRFEKYGFLTNQSTNKGRLITIVNWELYQGADYQTDKQTDKQLTSNRQATDKQLTTNKNDKNVRMKEDIYTSSNEDVLSSGADNTTVPYQEIVNLYNTITKSLPKVKALSDKRRRAIRASWNKFKSIDVFKTVFEKAEASDFLSGRNGRWQGCNFDWLVNHNNMIKVLEGTYDNKHKEGDNCGFSARTSNQKESGRGPYDYDKFFA